VSDRPPSSDLDRPARVLTVCLGNICRSPTAEAALVEAAADVGLALDVASAGTGDWHLGASPDARMRQAAADLDLELRGRAEQVSVELLRWADLVLVMDRRNLADVDALLRRSGVDTPVRLFRTFDPALVGTAGQATEGSPDLVAGPDRAYAPDEVPDPYSGGPDDFTAVVEICRRTAAAIVARWPEPLTHALDPSATAGRPDAGGHT
jgi:protein-tyrosine phosphatase